jgi:hypothetical protein
MFDVLAGTAPTEVLQNLADFREKTWKIPMPPQFTSLPTDHGSLKGDLIPCVDPFMTLSLFGADKRAMLIRAEYIRIYNELQKFYEGMTAAAAAIITGQPGIGMKPLYHVVFTPYSSFSREVALDPLCHLSSTGIGTSNHGVTGQSLVSIYPPWCSCRPKWRQ